MSKTSRKALVCSALFLAAGVLMAQSGGVKKFTVSPGSDLKFEALPGGPAGPTLAKLWGDPTKGAYGAIEKFPAGFSVPLHTHPATHKIVVISGTWIHGEPGKPDVRLGPGSYLVQPAGMKHTTACDAASECVFFIESVGKFGVKVVEEKKMASKK